MSGIAALLGLNGAGADARIGAAMLDRLAHRGPDGRGEHADGAAWLGQQHFVVTAEDAIETPPIPSRDGLRWIVADARIDNRDDLEAALGLRGASDGALLLAAYERWVDASPAHVIGDFAFVVWDAQQQRLFCARDHMGVRTLFYHRDARYFRCASDPHSLFADPAVSRRPNRRSLALYLSERFVEREETLYEAVFALPPGHSLVVTPGGMQVSAYWRPDPWRTVRHTNDAEYAEHFRAVFREAVRARLRARGPVTSQLSGGLDSSSVLGEIEALRRSGAVSAEPVTLIHAAFPGLPCDEDDYCRSLAAHWSLELTTVTPPSDRERTRPDPAKLHPDEQYSPLWFAWEEMFDAARKRGARAMLTGLGADQLMRRTGYEGAEALLRGDLSTFARATGLAEHPLSPASWYTALRDGVRRNAPDGLKAVSRRRREARRRPFLTEEARQMASDQAVSAERRIRSLHPGRATRELCDSLTHGYDVTYTLAQISQFSPHFGIELRHPFYDVRLVELLLAFPHEQRCGFHERKPLLRLAMDLPPLVRERHRVTEFTSYVHRVLMGDHGADVARLLANSRLAALEIIDTKRVRHVVEAAGRDWSLCRDAANLAALELWLRQTFI